MTVAPAISAECRSSAGIHLPGEAEHRLDDGACRRALEVVAEREQPPGRGLAAADLDAGDLDDVGRARQVDGVAGAHRRHDDAELHGDLAAQAAHPGEQVWSVPDPTRSTRSGASWISSACTRICSMSASGVSGCGPASA